MTAFVRILPCAVLASTLATPSVALSQVVLWTTGTPRSIYVNASGQNVFVPVVNGYDGATNPQRWFAVPFRLTQTSLITELRAYYTNLTPTTNLSVNYIIWDRTDLTAPTTMAATGSLGPYAPGLPFPGGTSNNDWDHRHSLNVLLGQGDYYLTIFGSGPTGQQSLIGWLAGGALQDPSLEQDFIWRSTSFPTPGFQPEIYTGPNQLPDPRDFYNLAFSISGVPIPEPSSLIMLGGVAFGCCGSALLRHRRARRGAASDAIAE